MPLSADAAQSRSSSLRQRLPSHWQFGHNIQVDSESESRTWVPAHSGRPRQVRVRAHPARDPGPARPWRVRVRGSGCPAHPESESERLPGQAARVRRRRRRASNRDLDSPSPLATESTSLTQHCGLPGGRVRVRLRVRPRVQAGSPARPLGEPPQPRARRRPLPGRARPGGHSGPWQIGRPHPRNGAAVTARARAQARDRQIQLRAAQA
jgi:hypothetical protein